MLVDPTLQAALSAFSGAIIAGGAVLAWHISDRQLRRVPQREGPVVSPEVTTVLSVLRSSAVVVDSANTVVKASAPAYALGLVSGKRLLVKDLSEMVDLVRRDGQIRENELHFSGRGVPQRTVNARVAPLGTNLVLALVEDRTLERRVEEVRRDFVANVSHELKTPVGAIKLLAEAVTDAADDPEAVERFAGRMVKESDRLSNLVQQIIDLSRLQTHDLVQQSELVSVDDMVSAALETSQIDAQAKNIALICTNASTATGMYVNGNPKQILSAVSNLVTNAVAYSVEGTTVSVSVRAEDDQVAISVIDQGIGIPALEVERIFERFYRVDPARHRSTGGSGLGLSIVKHVAATHGGDVAVWSVEGQGSTFTLTLPLAGNAQRPRHQAGPSTPWEKETPR